MSHGLRKYRQSSHDKPEIMMLQFPIIDPPHGSGTARSPSAEQTLYTQPNSLTTPKISTQQQHKAARIRKLPHLYLMVITDLYIPTFSRKQTGAKSHHHPAYTVRIKIRTLLRAIGLKYPQRTNRSRGTKNTKDFFIFIYLFF